MFTGVYFDGKSSRGHQAQIELRADGLYILLTPADGIETSMVWELDKIHTGHYSNTKKISLRYGDFPHRYLEVADPDFYASLTSFYPGKKFNSPDFQLLNKLDAKGVIAITVGFVALVLLSYFFLLPPVTEFLAARMPVEMEEKLGNQMYEQVTQGYHINQPLTKEANEFWRAMHVQSPYLINITVVNEEVPNAFALPGGQIIVYDGIIKEMKDYDEFAGLLAHEYTHVALRHSTRMMSRNLAGYLFISVLLNDASGTIAVLASNANQLKSLSFSRTLERQADEGGYRLLQSRNIDPDGMLKLFTTLKRVEGSSGIPAFISTHPLTDARRDYIKAELKKDKTVYANPHQDLKNIWAEMKADE
jgi:predicted Zn-dependent protease